MVVAARTSNRQAHDGSADHVDLIVHDVGQKFFFVGVAPAPVADGQHAGRDDFVKSGAPLPNGRGSDLQRLRL